MRYILVEAPDPDQLSKVVQRLLNEGWELYGSPMFAGFTTRPPVYAQALTNETDEQTPRPLLGSTEAGERLRALFEIPENELTSEQRSTRDSVRHIFREAF